MPIDLDKVADDETPAASAVLLEVREMVESMRRNGRRVIVTGGGILLLLSVAAGVLAIQAHSQGKNIKANATSAAANADANIATHLVVNRVDRTITSIVKRFEDAAQDPVNIAAVARSRERLIANCETSAAIAAAIGAKATPCPTEPAPVGPRAPPTTDGNRSD